MGGGCRLGEAAPFTVMVMMEGCTIALTIMAKTAMSRGMSPFVFVVYTNALGTLLLLPYSFFLHRERAEQPLFTLPLFLRFFFLGFTGIALSQNLAFVGLSCSSPIVVCVMGLLTPAFSFILSLVLRKSKVEWRRSSFQFKVIGTLVTVMGAISVVIYKGPYIRPSSSSQELQPSKHQLFVFYSAPDNWILGCILLAASFCVFHYGTLFSVIGAVISGAGYYTVTWGRMRGDEEQEESVKSSDEKIPLLQEDSEV